MIDQDKRQHRRLQIQLPLEFYPERAGRQATCRTITRDISSGGIYFEVEHEPLQEGVEIHLELTVPPGAHFPYEGRVKTTASVVRVEPADGTSDDRGCRFGIGARLEHWELAF
jgi:c-di-GMP-binding flagellar brake protein YcgR